MNKKINIAILFGGKSVEHEVSLQSGLNVARALDQNRYNIHFIGIDKEGNWNHYDPQTVLVNSDDPKTICLGEKGEPVNPFSLDVDVVFPVLHGALGEDGTVQELMRLIDIPFVGADVLGSAVGMDKGISKKLVKAAGFSTALSKTLKKGESVNSSDWNYPLFVKPSTGGSSVGITKVSEPLKLLSAIELACSFSEAVIIEEAVEGREIQVAVMGDHDPQASLPCEIIPKGEFHTYESKYIDEEGASFLYPAPLELDETLNIQQTALKIYTALACEGFGRVDLFLTKEGTIVFNEINTIPGLTNISPYSKMWQSSGVTYEALIDKLVTYALERHERQKSLVTDFNGVKTL